MAVTGSNSTETPDGDRVANDNATHPSPPAAAAPRLPQWSPEVTVRFAEVARSRPPSRRPSFVSRPAPPPDAGSLLLDSLALDYESPKRYKSLGASSGEDCEIGRGGIGKVCLLVDQHLGREVALKELLTDGPERQTTEAALRFLAEARITGQLEHPNIVPVYDIGRRHDGRLYYTMRVIRGQTLAHALSEAHTLAQRLDLLPHVARACNAIAYAHSRGVIHRDIKPDNIMIGQFGETVVLDWGIAKLREAAGGSGLAQPRGVVELTTTSSGGLVGTPLYMSPEQVTGQQELDETTDVWSLGVLLYVVLSGRLPFHGEEFSAVRARILRGRPKPLRKLEPALPPELVAIVERALAREKSGRYPDAKHLASDLDAYMSGARVLAHQYSLFDLIRRFARRHRAASWVAVFAVVVSMAQAALLQRRILHERDRAVVAERTALDKEHLARVSLAEYHADRSKAALDRGDLSGALASAVRSLTESETSRARGLLVTVTGLDMWVPTPAPLVFSGSDAIPRLTWQGSRVVELDDPKSGAKFELPMPMQLSGAAVAPGGHVVALGGRRGEIVLWWPDARRTLSIDGHRGSVVALAFSSDATTLATGGLDRSVHLWQVSTGALSDTVSADLGQPVALAFDDDGTRLFVATHEREVIELERRDLSHETRIPALDHPVEAFVSATSELIVVETPGGRLAWRKDVPDVRARFAHPSNVLALGYIGETRLAAGGLARDGVCLFDLTRSDCTTRLPLQSEQVRVIDYAPEASRLALGMSNGDVVVWNATSLLPERVLNAHAGGLRGLVFTSDGSHLLSAGIDGALAKWDMTTGAAVWRRSAGHGIQHLAADASSDAIWASTRGGTVQRWSASGELTASLVVTKEWAMAAAASAQLRTLFAVTGEGELIAVDPGTSEVRAARRAHEGRALTVQLSPDQRVLATGGEDGRVLLWSPATTELMATLIHHRGAVRALQFSPDGRHLTSAGDDRSIRQWDLSRLLTPASQLPTNVASERTPSRGEVPVDSR